MSAAAESSTQAPGWMDPAHLRACALIGRSIAGTLAGPPRSDLLRYCRQLERRAEKLDRRETTR